MEKGLAYVWLHLLLLALVFDKGHSIKCYVCWTTDDPHCHDPVANNMNPSECKVDLVAVTLQRFRGMFSGLTDINKLMSSIAQGGEFTCTKVETVLPNFHSGGANTTIVRGCMLERGPTDNICSALTVKAPGQNLKFCEFCNTEACNGAEGIKRSSALLSMSLPILGTILYLRQ